MAADALLGIRMLITASSGVCPFRGGFNCNVHTVIGCFITVASVIDLVMAYIVGQLFEHVLTRLDKRTRKACGHLLAIKYRYSVVVVFE